MADILHALRVDLARLVAGTPLATWLLPCLGSGMPSSPQLEPQQGELDTLLEPEAGWDDRLDGELSHLQRGFKASRQNQPFAPHKQSLSLRLNSLFGTKPRPEAFDYKRTDTPARERASSKVSASESFLIADADEDAHSLQTPTLDRLAERFDPGLSVEQMEREEAEQADRERVPGQRDERFDFGDFASA